MVKTPLGPSDQNPGSAPVWVLVGLHGGVNVGIFSLCQQGRGFLDSSSGWSMQGGWDPGFWRGRPAEF